MGFLDSMAEGAARMAEYAVAQRVQVPVEELGRALAELGLVGVPVYSARKLEDGGIEVVTRFGAKVWRPEKPAAKKRATRKPVTKKPASKRTRSRSGSSTGSKKVEVKGKEAGGEVQAEQE